MSSSIVPFVNRPGRWSWANHAGYVLVSRGARSRYSYQGCDTRLCVASDMFSFFTARAASFMFPKIAARQFVVSRSLPACSWHLVFTGDVRAFYLSVYRSQEPCGAIAAIAPYEGFFSRWYGEPDAARCYWYYRGLVWYTHQVTIDNKGCSYRRAALGLYILRAAIRRDHPVWDGYDARALTGTESPELLAALRAGFLDLASYNAHRAMVNATERYNLLVAVSASHAAKSCDADIKKVGSTAAHVPAIITGKGINQP